MNLNRELKRNKSKINKRIQLLLLATVTGMLAIVFIAKPDIVMTSVRNATHLCADTVVPSLFPFLILSSFIVNAGLAQKSGKLLSPVTSFIFNLPGIAGTAILMGLIGGFPVGPKMTSQLYEKGYISQNQAKTMMLFTINAGPAFVISTVGFSMFGSIQYGLLLYISMILSSMTIGIVVCGRLKESPTDVKPGSETANNLGEALCVSVNSGTSSIINICAFVILFAALTSAIGIFINNTQTINCITAILEVTRGCSTFAAEAHTLSSTVILPLTAAVLSFSGICVHCQIFDCIRNVGLPYHRFLIWRGIGAALAALYCRAGVLLFPEKYQVFSNMAESVNAEFSLSIATCACMLFMSILLILDLDIDEKLC